MSSLIKAGRPMPTKLSEWLRVAVEDTKRIPAECSTEILRFVPDMSYWARSDNGTCSICLAGSALIGAGLWSPNESRNVSDSAVARAINELRGGNVDGALEEFLGAGRLLTPRVDRAAERVFEEAWEAHNPCGDLDDYSREEALDELASVPTPGARASDEAYLELADALAEMGL